MADKRVSFDFEVDFSNGGGIQGQSFRLDTDGDNIADDALAAYCPLLHHPQHQARQRPTSCQ